MSDGGDVTSIGCLTAECGLCAMFGSSSQAGSGIVLSFALFSPATQWITQCTVDLGTPDEQEVKLEVLISEASPPDYCF